MEKFGTLLFLAGATIFISNLPVGISGSWNTNVKDSIVVAQVRSGYDAARDSDTGYRYPEFYRGMYLNVSSANNFKKLQAFVEKAKAATLNTLVLDVQSARNVTCMVPESHVRYCKDNGLHPVARIVVFPDGLRNYPVPESYIEDKLAIAEDACKNGFKEIQFDYIRFHDSDSTRHLTYSQRYKFIEDFITRARIRTKRFNARIAADIFGRIPLNTDDIIGQKIESLDKVVDLICPMAYPSHYTWNKKYYTDPYYTVRVTSTQAKLRSRNAMIVTYIQAFKMKMAGIPFETYIMDQLKAVHDSGIKGFIMWNARQEYETPLAVVKDFYLNQISKKDKPPSAYVD
ncbi:MAG: hypothetical protein A2176_15485 [Spirochaetes bacterium RBG_13_51_14]|nr:MAG: hypothetical protein A2176_15485 [Spirochaetes bacterium RBG_13_51_14]